MNPFFFGTAERALFGVYHPPRVRGGSQEGVVLCYPFGVEYMRAHRAFRQLTTLLTRTGTHVLRFDYLGTGDSMGEGEAATLDGWRMDVNTAVQELKDTAGIERVSLIGLRLGAMLAARALQDRTDVTRVVLWDPVVSGERYLGDVLGRPANEGFEEGSECIGITGFPLSRRLFEEIREIDLDGSEVPRHCAVDLVVSHPHADFERLREALSSHGVLRHFELVPSEGNWAEGDAFGSALLPQGIIQHIVEQVTGAGIS